jgi:putative heme-binding domain-containing protein
MRCRSFTFALALLTAPAAAQEYRVPAGFRVENAAELSESFVAMTFGPDGALLVSLEDGGLLSLSDPPGGGGEGSFDVVQPFCDELRSCQGLAWHDGRVYATGQRDGKPGLWRITPGPDGARAARVELVIGVHDWGEHGAHAIVPGPDGRLWVVVGNHSYFESPPEPSSALLEGYEGNLLAKYEDPRGHAVGKRYPGGFVARVDAETGAWDYQSVGYRNAYDLAFDAFGEPFTCDSDMEWDVGLPWYRPVRVVHAQPGADFGWRSGSGKWPDWYPDSVPPVVDIGRGSPTGVAIYQAERYPTRYRGALFVGDWSEGRILSVHLTPQGPEGAGWHGTVEPLVEVEGVLNVTDLEVGPDGCLYFTSGGRGGRGRVQRLVYEAPAAPPPADPIEAALAQPQPWSAWGRARTDACRSNAAERWVPGLERALLDAARPAEQRVRALWLLEQASGPSEAQRLAALLGDGDAVLRAAAAERLTGKSGGAWIQLWSRAFQDSDARVRRAACAAMWQEPRVVWPYRVRLAAQLAHPDARVRREARAALERAGMFTLPDAVEPTGVRERVEWALLMARHPLVGPAALQGVVNPLWNELAQVLKGMRSSPEEKRDALRAAALARERFADIAKPPPAYEDVRAFVLAAFPSGEARLDHELAILLAHWQPDGAVAKLLDALAAEPDPAQQIHYAYCAHRMTQGWTPELRRRLFAWLEVASEWTGGASLPGYLALMRDTFVDSVPPEECLEMARAGAASAHTLALFLGRLEPGAAAPLVAALRASWAALPSGERGTPEHAAKSRVLRALVGVRVPGLPELLHELFAADGHDHEALWIALAELADAQDYPLFLRGLATPSGEVREACAEALKALGRVPAEPEVWRGVLDAGARFGWPRGNVHLGVLGAWRGEGGGPPAGTDRQEDWQALLEAWEAWFGERWPDWTPPQALAAPRPAWSAQQIAGFLVRSSARPGSPQLGAEVFVRATCATCHAVGTWKPPAPLTGWGPDLYGVTKRFATEELVDTIVAPSSFVSDQHRLHVLITTDDERFTGRVVADDDAGVSLLLDDGKTSFVPRAEVAELVPSSLSAMPEGLLAPLTLEETKDLFAFLAAERLEPAPARAWQPLVGASQLELGSPNWSVRDGVLVGASTGLSQNDYLWVKGEHADFELELDVRVTPGGNSGVQYRSRPGGGPDPEGYQADVGQRYWGTLYEHGRGTLADADARLADVLDPGGWNHVYVRVAGERHAIEINGLTTVEMRDAEHESGRIAFQLHQGQPMEVRFANVRLRALD